ncbi:MAG: DNA polymerase III subunit delta [Proteobacteria bacterium]|nr:DNA polymerase III subunit delta [Pseudomonadota bacterium]
MADVLDRIKQGKLDPVYVLLSEQPFLIQRLVTAILDAAVPPSARGFNYDIVQGKAFSADRVLTAAQTLPMMAERRMVLCRDLSAVSAAELAKLVPYLEAPSPTTVLVATVAKADKRIKFYAQAKKKKVLHELSAPKSLAPWIRAEAADRQVAIQAQAAARLADVIGKDLARIALSLEQLSLYSGGRPITAADVDDLIADTRERSVFELTEAIGQGDLAGALTSVASLCEQRQSAIGVVVMLARHMRQLGQCVVARSERLSKFDVAKRVGVPPFVAGKLISQARRYRPEAIGIALRKLSQADRELKGQTNVIKTLGRPLGERAILDRIVTELVALGR